MKLWRISNHCSLDGLGGERTSGRWHNSRPGKPVVYTAEHPALALIESLANLTGSPASLPRDYQLIQIDVADAVRTTEIGVGSLPAEWRDDLNSTRRIGDAWLAKVGSALLRIPAGPSPESWNYLLNPLHPDAHQVKIDWCRRIAYDSRLFAFRERS